MQEWSATRRFPRYELRFPVFYKLKSQPLAPHKLGRTRNLSEGGACLELPERLAPATLLAVILRTAQENIQAEAEVIWVRDSLPRPGGVHGVSFTQLHPEHHQALRGLLPQEGDSRTASGFRRRKEA